MSTFKFGPVQTLWLHNLKTFPKRQIESQLGEGTPENYKACCLGELLVCNAIVNNLDLPFKNGYIIDGNLDAEVNTGYPMKSFSALGLRDFKGSTKKTSLAKLNDGGSTWPEIATFVEENANQLFTKSF